MILTSLLIPDDASIRKKKPTKAVTYLRPTFLLSNGENVTRSTAVVHEGERSGDEARWPWHQIPWVCGLSPTFQLCDLTEGYGLSEPPYTPPGVVQQDNQEKSAALTQPLWVSALSNGWLALCCCSCSGRALFMFQAQC